jgi:uncharacterized protein HemX
MKPPEPEQEEKPGPGVAAKKAALGVIDAFLAFFQRQHDRLAGPESHDDRHGRVHEKHDPEAAAAPTRPSLPRKLLIWLVLLLAGLGAGGYLSYRTLSLQLAKHDGVVEGLQGEIEALRKEEARNIKLLDKFQRENAEYRHEAREAQREAENASRRATELEAQIDAMKAAEAKRSEDAAQAAQRAAGLAKQRPRQSTPQKTGNCAAGTAAEIAACIEKFNR